MKKFLGTFLKLLLLTILVAAFWNYKLVLYGFSQLRGQLNIIWHAKPVDEILGLPGINQDLKKKLLLTNEIRKFAMDSLGLKNSKNYTTFYDQKDQPVMWVVTGCLPFQLKAKEWWFPFLGNVSYKGFFIERNAKTEEQLIRQQGYETDIYSPSAWSTLGFFKDPILSGMLKRGPGRLSELIIHELTHSTIYIKSDVDYNENLATFIGEKGAQLFLVSKYGIDSEEMKKYRGYLFDEELYSEYMMKSAQQLDSLFDSFGADMPVYEKALKKYRLIAAIMSNIKNLPLAYPERYIFNFQQSRLPNNTEFMSFLRYRKKQDQFSQILEEKYHGDLRKFIKGMKESMN